MGDQNWNGALPEKAYKSHKRLLNEIFQRIIIQNPSAGKQRSRNPFRAGLTLSLSQSSQAEMLYHVTENCPYARYCPWECAAGTLIPFPYTRPCLAAFCDPILDYM